MANSWDEFFYAPIKASKKLHVTPEDVARGAKIDARNAQRRAAAEALLAEQSRTAPTGLPYGMTPRPSEVPSDAPNLYEGDNTKAARSDLISNALLAGNLGALSSAFGALAPFRAGLAVGAGSDAVLNAGEGGELPAAMAGAGVLGRRALPMALATGAAYAGDATAGSRYDPSAFLKYIRQHFPDMFDSAKQGMKFTADTGREAGVYGLLGDSMSVKPRMIVHGSTNSVALPRDVRRELIDSANAFDMHTHPSGNALPSTPLNNAAQNALGGDTEYYQRTSRGTPWLRPGKADNLIVSVQPRAVREPLDFGNGRGESWTHMKMNEYPSKQELNSLDEYLVNNADRYENMLPMGDIGMMIPDDLNTFALLKHYADTGRGDFTYNLGKEVFGPGGREPATPMYEAIYDQLRKDKQLRNYADGGLVKSGLKMLFPNLSAPLHVVKPKGGNWLSGTVEEALRPLKNNVVRYDHPRFNELLPEDQARLHADGVFGAMDNFPPEVRTRINEKLNPINSWIEGPLTKYVKTRMASPEDEVRRLADEGVLHFEPLGIRDQSPIMRDIVEARTQGGFAPQGYADSPLGAQWEKYADSAIDPRKVRDFTGDQRTIYEPGNEWMKKAPSDTPVYRTDPNNIGTRAVENLGFPHLIDELTNAMNPSSGLPQHLLLSPEAVKQMSMEKAVRRVADINQFRKAAMEQARLKELETSRMLGTTTREYAENNPMGLRWVEYTRPEKLHEGVTNIAKHGDEYVALGADGQPIAQRLPDGSTGRLATGKTPEDAHLAGQLITEGNIMGHCVGGYCEDVASGRSRIFSLRDAKGEPHVTVEVAPQPRNIGQQDIPGNYIDDAMEQLGIHEPEAQWGREEEIDQLAGDLWRKDNPDSQRIIQIKGKQNRAPNPEYLPFIQDFVKNPPHGQPWGDVGDLQNSGLRRTRDALNDLEQKTLREKGQEFGDYLSDAEIQALQAQFSSNGGKFASGGSVGVPATGWELLTDPTGSPEENKLSWDIFSGHNDPEQLEAVQ